MKTISPFEVERMRSVFASSGDLKSFKESYSKKNTPEIKRFGIDGFWDNFFSKKVDELNKSSVFKDKKRKVCSLLSDKKGKLLSVGFGTGAIEKEISKLNKKIELFGIDKSKKAVENFSCSTIGYFKRGDILKIPFKSSSFDIVLALDILEHVSPTKIFQGYRELKRVLKSGGFLVVSVPLNEDLEKMVEKGENPNLHLRAYTPEILKAELGIFSFIILKEIYLYAFSRFYSIKMCLVKMLFFLKIRDPNLIIIMAKK